MYHAEEKTGVHVNKFGAGGGGRVVHDHTAGYSPVSISPRVGTWGQKVKKKSKHDGSGEAKGSLHYRYRTKKK